VGVWLVSAETLRRAAALMRERAEAATEGPWSAEAIGSEGYHVFGPNGSRAPMKGRARVAACTWQDWDEVKADADHIASWHPAVALAVADWLDAEAKEYDRLILASGAVNILLRLSDEPVEARLSIGYHTLDQALAVATAYLGEA
jgi:hypothetical protein